MSKFPNTVKWLAERRRFYQKQVLLNELATRLLEKGTDLIFEVHIPQDMPRRIAIMAEGKDFRETVLKAKRLWEQKNNNGQEASLRPNVIIRAGNIRVAISPEDADQFATNADLRMLFSLDCRMGGDNPIHPMVFSEGELMPNIWLASSPTSEPEPTAVPV